MSHSTLCRGCNCACRTHPPVISFHCQASTPSTLSTPCNTSPCNPSIPTVDAHVVWILGALLSSSPHSACRMVVTAAVLDRRSSLKRCSAHSWCAHPATPPATGTNRTTSAVAFLCPILASSVFVCAVVQRAYTAHCRLCKAGGRTCWPIGCDNAVLA